MDKKTGKYLYVVWFQDRALEPSEQDYEWCACINIETDTPKNALEWGDYLAKQYALRNAKQLFQKSYIDSEPMNEMQETRIPLVKYGQLASDEEIGW